MAGHLFGGFASSLDRLRAAARRPEPEPTFHALFETLNWCVAVDDYVGAVWAPDGVVLGWTWRTRVGGDDSDEMMGAVRHARNVVHHHWADALEAASGAVLPLTLPAYLLSWRWRHPDDLPPLPRGDRGFAATNRRCYADRFAGQPVDATLSGVADGLDSVGRFLR